MPTKAKDLKALDEQERRVFCRDGHRIEWSGSGPATQDAREYSMGLCSAGDHWKMETVGFGRSKRWQLAHMGYSKWTSTGQFKITRTATWATTAHVAGDQQAIDFNCSHAHYHFPSQISIGRDEARRQYEAGLPQEIRACTDAESIREAIRLLSEQGWDFVTDNRIRCTRCIAEEIGLVAKLAELKAMDEA